MTLTDPDCTANVTDPNEDEALAAVEEEAGSLEDVFDEMLIGVHFSDTITISCAQPSN